MAEDTSSPESAPTASPTDLRTFLIADIRGYTRFTQDHGDEAASVLAATFAGVVRATVPGFGGDLLELRGDEAVSVFGSVRQALRAAVELQRRLRTSDEGGAAFPLAVGVGMDAGEAVPTEGGYRGAALNLAARLCAMAKPGQILASESVGHLARRVEGLRLVPQRPVRLKGMTEPVRLLEVLPVDPLPPPPTAPVAPGRRSRARTLAIVGAALAVLLLAIGFVGLASRHGSGSTLLIPANGVGVIDAGSLRMTAALSTVGDRPVAVAYGAGSLWVANSSSDTVTQVNPRTLAHQNYSVGYTPTGIAFLNGAVWVTTSGDGRLCQINPGTPRCVSTPYAGNGPTGITAADGALYVTDSADDLIARIGPDGRIKGRVDAGIDPTAIAFGYNHLWVANESVGTVTPIGLPGLQRENPVSVGAGPDSVAVGHGQVWVANHLADTISMIDPNTLNAITHPVPADPESIVVRGSEVWVACRGAGVVEVLDARTLATKRVIHTGGAPGSLAAGPGSQVFVSTLPSPGTAGGGTLVVATGSLQLTNLPPGNRFPSLDPASWRTYNLGSVAMLASLGDGLVGYKRVAGADGETLVPDLAEQLPTVTNGGTTYTFTLRPRLRYSNGAVVRASDIRYEIERQLIQNPPNSKTPIPQFFSGITGATGCTRTHCELSRGIAVDNAARTITFHLVKPDPDFLYVLATPFAFAVPASTPIGDQLLKPIPMTGPYELESFDAVKQAVFIRNQQFHEWSEDAQPQGYPDTMVWKVIPGGDKTVTAIERGRADWSYDPPPPDRIAELGTRYTSQLHPGLWADTRFWLAPADRAPFNDPRVVRALDDAIDRIRVAQIFGSTYADGRLLALPTCQILPANYAGYSPTCPYVDASGAPKFQAALRLVQDSGTAGTHVTITYYKRDPGTSGVATYLAGVLRRLGYPAVTKPRGDSCWPPDTLSVCGWIADYPTPGDFVSVGLCSSFGFCPTWLTRPARTAYARQGDDPALGFRLWNRIDAAVTRAGSPWIPLWTDVSPGFVSRRISNFQWNPVQAVLLDQLAIR